MKIVKFCIYLNNMLISRKIAILWYRLGLTYDSLNLFSLSTSNKGNLHYSDNRGICFLYRRQIKETYTIVIIEERMIEEALYNKSK